MSRFSETPVGKVARMAMEVTSQDGTTIAFDRSGDGPSLVLVGGALADRSAAAQLSARLAPHFTVIAYDRRGRGDSGDTAPYAVEREVAARYFIGTLDTTAEKNLVQAGATPELVSALKSGVFAVPASKVAAVEAEIAAKEQRRAAQVEESRKLVVTPRGKRLFVTLIGVDATLFSRS